MYLRPHTLKLVVYQRLIVVFGLLALFFVLLYGVFDVLKHGIEIVAFPGFCLFFLN